MSRSREVGLERSVMTDLTRFDEVFDESGGSKWWPYNTIYFDALAFIRNTVVGNTVVRNAVGSHELFEYDLQ